LKRQFVIVNGAIAKEKYTLKNKSFTQPCMSSNVVARKILILAANPKSTSRLRLDQEVREIDEGLYFDNSIH